MTLRIVEFKEDYSNGKAVHMVLLAPSGDAFTKTQTWFRVKSLQPKANMDDRTRSSESVVAMQARWETVQPAYEAWLNKTEIPETGTPLAAWSGVSPDQAALFKSQGITTVEAVRDMSESTFTKLPFPNARKMPALAGKFLEGEDASTKDARLAEMEERMAVMTEMLEAATAPVEKPRRGRPPKVQIEDDGESLLNTSTEEAINAA